MDESTCLRQWKKLMHESIRKVINQAAAGQDATVEEAHSAIAAIMDGQCSEVDIAALLTAWYFKGEAVSEIVGAATAMRERSTKIPTDRTGLLDTCGTGGDRLHTINISTAAALVTAAMGVPVAKQSNWSVSTSSGTDDVLSELGVQIELSPKQVARCIDEVGIGFCFAPLLHSAMKHAAPVRRQLEFRTIFNLLGPLTNPAEAGFQVIGTGSDVLARKLASALQQLGTKHALVVCGDNRLDEVSLWGQTLVIDVRAGGLTESVWTAASFGLDECDVDDIRASSADDSAARLMDVFRGEAGPCRDIVVANAAAALIASERFTDPKEAARSVQSALDSGYVTETLEKLSRLSATLAKTVG